VEAFQLVVDRQQLRADVIGVLKLGQVGEDRLDLVLAVNQQPAFTGTGFVTHGDSRVGRNGMAYALCIVLG
jgi:hypothetical protein